VETFPSLTLHAPAPLCQPSILRSFQGAEHGVCRTKKHADADSECRRDVRPSILLPGSQSLTAQAATAPDAPRFYHRNFYLSVSLTYDLLNLKCTPVILLPRKTFTPILVFDIYVFLADRTYVMEGLMVRLSSSVCNRCMMAKG